MVSKIVRNITTFVFAIMFLVVTSGFTVFHHSCASKQTSELSFVIPAFSCEHYNETADNNMHSCCSIDDTSDHDACGTDKCCDTETIIVKLDVTFDIHYSHQTSIISYIEIPSTDSLEPEYGSDEQNPIILCNNRPPPLSGKDLHIFLNQLNISPAIV